MKARLRSGTGPLNTGRHLGGQRVDKAAFDIWEGADVDCGHVRWIIELRRYVAQRT